MNTTKVGLALLISLATALVPMVGHAGDLPVVDRYAVPSTVSPEAAKALGQFYGMNASQPPMSRPADLADWDRKYALMNALATPYSRAVASALDVTVVADRIGDVPVLRLRPPNYRPGRVLVFLHGGAYTFFSAEATLMLPARVAAATGTEVISVDYTVAPRGTFHTVTDQALAVWKGLLAQGIEPADTGLFGDSAGGGLAAGSVLKMRDQGLPLPGALYLLSPWTDITGTGDTMNTLAAAEPMLNAEGLGWSADAYAPREEQKNPYVSPVYGDLAKPFPATLIQVGTREIFLSDAVRMYQAIRGGGHDAVLDIYEGMPHVFPGIVGDAPEGRTAIARAAEFFTAHLKKTN